MTETGSLSSGFWALQNAGQFYRSDCPTFPGNDKSRNGAVTNDDISGDIAKLSSIVCLLLPVMTILLLDRQLN